MSLNRYIYSFVESKTSFCYVDTREFDLQRKIDLEIKMREGTAKLLAACKHTNQCLEVAKSLLTSDMRLVEFNNELQKRKQSIQNNRNKTKNDLVPPPLSSRHQAKVSVSDIRIPLIFKDSDYFKSKGDHRRFAVFCLLKIGTEIYDTIMVNVDRNITDIVFDDSFHFNQVSPDFRFELFIYARILQDDLSMASTQRKLSHKISNSLSRSLGRKMASYKDDFDPETGPKFYLIAKATLTVEDSADLIKTYDLDIEEGLDKQLQLPLFGHFCCRLAVQPECLLQEYFKGILKLISAPGIKPSKSPEMYWCLLAKFKMNLWHIKPELKDEKPFLKHMSGKRAPDMVIPINSHSKFQPNNNNIITVTNSDGSYTFESINNQAKEWFKSLNCCKEDFLAWEPIAEYNMELAPISHHRSQFLFHNRPSGSLYHETPLQDPEFHRKRHSKSFSYSSTNLFHQPNNNNNNNNGLRKPLK